MTRADFVINHAETLATLGGPRGPRRGPALGELGVVTDGAVAVKNGKIVAVGTSTEVRGALEGEFEEVDARGKLVTPGLIDPHVHLIFAGTRESELEDMAVRRTPYLKIKEEGGGMPTTLRKTAETPMKELIAKTSGILDRMLIHGTTTIEAKSGYEMTYQGEIRQLEIIGKLNDAHPVDLVPTFLAQGIPFGLENRVDELTEEIVRRWLPEIARRKLAEYCDVFCESGYFNLKQSRAILEAGTRLGMKPRIHADWLGHSGGAKLGSELGVVSADHLIFTPTAEIDELARGETLGTFLPTTPFCYVGRYANARDIIQRGLPVALGTDLSAADMCESMQMMMTLAVLQMKMTSAEALAAATINAAHSIGREKEIGSLEVGKKADIVIFDAPNPMHFAYHYGVNLAEMVFKDGKLVAERGRIVQRHPGA